MKLKFIFLSFLSVVTLIPAFASDNYLHIQTSTGWQVLNIDNVDKLTFKGGNMTATDSQDKTVLSVPQQDLVSLNVNESAGVEAIVANSAAEATFLYDSTSRKAILSQDGNFEIYNAAGALLVSIPAVHRGQEIDLSAITPGIVILKSGNYTLKTVLK